MVMSEEIPVKVLEERPEQLLIYNKGHIMAVANTPYFKVKWEIFHGNRIIQQFPENSEVQETFDDRIFNVVYKGNRLQVRQDHADLFARVVEKFVKTGNAQPFFKICQAIYLQDHKHEIIDKMLLCLKGVTKSGNDYIVNEFFKVDNKGVTYYLDTDKAWHHLCTVVKGSIEKQEIPTPIGSIELDVTSQTIISKVYFLLFPNLSDGVFTRQLPKYIMDELRGDKPSAETILKDDDDTTTIP